MEDTCCTMIRCTFNYSSSWEASQDWPDNCNWLILMNRVLKQDVAAIGIWENLDQKQDFSRRQVVYATERGFSRISTLSIKHVTVSGYRTGIHFQLETLWLGLFNQFLPSRCLFGSLVFLGSLLFEYDTGSFLFILQPTELKSVFLLWQLKA